MLAAAWITAVATGLLAAFAVVTAWYARKAFQEQARELGVLQRQAETTREMLGVQSDELDHQQQQFNAQKDLNAKQTTVLELRAREL
jgi:membrane protein implicated in regulation of membrane protease activity